MKFIKTVLAFVASILLICVLVAIGSEDEDKGHAKINQTTTKQEMKQETKKVKEVKKSNEEIRMDEMMNEELGYFDRIKIGYSNSGNITGDPYMEGGTNCEGFVTFITFIYEYMGRGDDIVIGSSIIDQYPDKGYGDMHTYCLDKKNNKEIIFRCRLKFANSNKGFKDYGIYSISLLRPLVNNEPMSDSEVKKMMAIEPFTKLRATKEETPAYESVRKSSDYDIPKNNK